MKKCTIYVHISSASENASQICNDMNSQLLVFVMSLDLGCVQVSLHCLLPCLSCIFSIISYPDYINNDNFRENSRFGFAGIAVIQLLLAPDFYFDWL